MQFTITNEDGTTERIEIPDNLIRDWNTTTRKMARLLHEIRQHAPGAGLYLEENTPHLMGGSTHGKRKRPLQENIIATGPRWPGSGGGGW